MKQREETKNFKEEEEMETIENYLNKNIESYGNRITGDYVIQNWLRTATIENIDGRIVYAPSGSDMCIRLNQIPLKDAIQIAALFFASSKYFHVYFIKEA